MSDHEEERPLTRRERRLQEMAATGALDLSEVGAQPAGQPTPVDEPTDAADATASSADEIEISPVNEDGTPRSRREMRQLREAALAELAAAREADAAAAVEAAAPEDPDPAEAEPAEAEPAVAEVVESEPAGAEVVEAEPLEAPAVEETTAEETDAEEPDDATVAFDASELAAAESRTPAVDEAPEERIDFDTLISPPTEAFTVEELAEAESAGSAADAEPAAAPEPAADPDPAADPESIEAPEDAAAEAPAEPAKSKRRFPWKRNKADEDAAVEAEAPVEAALADAEPAASAPAEPEAPAEPVAAAEPVPAAPQAPAPAEPVPSPRAAEPEPAAAEPEPAPTYSFPDIAPPEEWRSVFDDPTPRTGSGQRADGDFDDLISRAVAQESTASSNTSALILPTMPEDTGGLTGPLGATGDMYVTGSLKLPKSLGETGGHSALHDSVEVDPVSGMPEEDPQVTAEQAGLAPVAARHAVSAQITSSIPVVAKPVKERNKLPLVLSLTGGGLLVVVAGIGVVGATQGWFG